MTPNRTRPAVILLIEDDPGDQELTTRAFKEGRLNNELHIVNDGEEALNYLLRRARYSNLKTAPRPDIILLDLNLPKIDGRQVLREMQEHPEISNIPVIVLTTSTQEDDIARCYDLGIKSYIEKPVELDKFIDCIKMLGEYWFQLVILPPPNGE